MASSILIAVVCFVCGIVAAIPIGERLIGGKDAPDGAFPYVVSLRNKNNVHKGTGTIISDSWILSVAQITTLAHASVVVVGTTKLSENGTTYKISKKVVHPNYNFQMANDIALIQIDGKMSFGPNVKAVELPSTTLPNGTEVTIAGWGHIDHHDHVPDRLQYINMTIIDNEECRQACNTSICTIGPVGIGATSGDSGDPVVSNGVVFGLSAWYTWPPASGKLDGHTNVALYIDWIKQVTGN